MRAKPTSPLQRTFLPSPPVFRGRRVGDEGAGRDVAQRCRSFRDNAVGSKIANPCSTIRIRTSNVAGKGDRAPKTRILRHGWPYHKERCVGKSRDLFSKYFVNRPARWDILPQFNPHSRRRHWHGSTRPVAHARPEPVPVFLSALVGLGVPRPTLRAFVNRLVRWDVLPQFNPHSCRRHWHGSTRPVAHARPELVPAFLSALVGLGVPRPTLRAARRFSAERTRSRS